MAIAFDFSNRHILLTGAEASDVQLQDLCDAIAAAEYTEEGIQYETIADEE